MMPKRQNCCARQTETNLHQDAANPLLFGPSDWQRFGQGPNHYVPVFGINAIRCLGLISFAGKSRAGHSNCTEHDKTNA
jgi:hypothetical protein